MPCPAPAVVATWLLLAAAPLAAQDPPRPDPDALPEKIALPPDPGSAPSVTIRRIDNGDTVEEYRINGRLSMLRVRPLRGPAYTVHDANGDGKLDRRDLEGPVAPVYWTLYAWD